LTSPFGGWHAEHALVNYRLQDDKLHAIWGRLVRACAPPQISLRFGITQLGVGLSQLDSLLSSSYPGAIIGPIAPAFKQFV
jgi:hypothetical protein